MCPLVSMFPDPARRGPAAVLGARDAISYVDRLVSRRHGELMANLEHDCSDKGN